MAIGVSALASGPAPGDTLALDALADATVDSALPDLNQGNALELAAGWAEDGGEQSLRALLGFDLSPLPANAIIESAFLEIERVEAGDDGVIARIDQPWIEDAVTWDAQPTYAGPVALPAGGDPAQWDVTSLVIAAHMAQLPTYGFAVLETPGDAATARYRSRESGAGARLIINYELDVPDEPQPPPVQSAPVFSIDPGLEPIAPAIGDIVADGVPYDRPLAALLMEADTPFSFVAGEVIITPADAAELEVFLDAFGGIVLASPGLPDPPPELAEQVRPVAPDGAWLIRIDPDLVDPSGIDAAAAEFGLRGEQRVSSDAGLRTIALVLQGSQAGLQLSLNLAGQLTQDFPPLELEEQARTGGWEDPINDAATFPEHDDDGNNFTGTNRAWQYLAFARRSGPIDLVVIDSGFCLQPDGSRCVDAGGQPHIDQPASVFQYDFNGSDYNASGDSLDPSGGKANHGSGSAAIATAAQDNRYGIAGTGSPVARPILFRVAVEVFQLAKSIRTAVKWGARVVNMSWIAECGAGCRFFSGFSGYGKLKDALQLAEASSVITVAAAGNANVDLDDNFLVPCVLRWTTLCVGSLAANSTSKASGSNYGTNSISPIGPGGVRTWAPGESVRVGPDRATAGNHDVSGTSIASPFVAGALALALGVDPTLSAKQVQNLVFATRRASADPLVAAGSIDVKRLVQAAGPPLDDALGNHSSTAIAADLTSAGLDDLTLTRGEVDVFRFQADGYYDAVTFRARYVEALGDLRLDGIGGTAIANKQKTSGAQTTTYDASTPDLCFGEEAYVRLRGANAAVGNGYRMELLPTAATSLNADSYEPNDDSKAPAAIAIPRETSIDLFTVDRIDCRAGLTLDVPADVDQYAFTVAPGDFDVDYTGVSVRLSADFAITAKLFLNGAQILTDTGASIALEDDTAAAGAYRLEVSGNALNAYTLRARIYDPDARVRAYELEDWLKDAFLIAPDDFLPGCGGGCPPLPPFLAGFPWDEKTRFALEANGVIPVEQDFGFELPLGDGPRFLALGTSEAGLLRVTLALPGGFRAAAGAEAADALYAVLQDAQGNEVWRVEGVTVETVLIAEIAAGETYVLTVNGAGAGEAAVTVDLPGSRAVERIPAFPAAAVLGLLGALMVAGLKATAGVRKPRNYDGSR